MRKFALLVLYMVLHGPFEYQVLLMTLLMLNDLLVSISFSNHLLFAPGAEQEVPRCCHKFWGLAGRLALVSLVLPDGGSRFLDMACLFRVRFLGS